MPPKPPEIPLFDWKKLAEAKFIFERMRSESLKYLVAKTQMSSAGEPASCPQTAEELCQALTTWYWEQFNPWAEWVTNQIGGDPGGTPLPPPPPFK